jgi:hypothetical protein
LKFPFVAFWALGLLCGVDGPGKEVKNRVAAIAVKLVNRHAAPSSEGNLGAETTIHKMINFGSFFVNSRKRRSHS